MILLPNDSIYNQAVPYNEQEPGVLDFVSKTMAKTEPVVARDETGRTIQREYTSGNIQVVQQITYMFPASHRRSYEVQSASISLNQLI